MQPVTPAQQNTANSSFWAIRLNMEFKVVEFALRGEACPVMQINLVFSGKQRFRRGPVRGSFPFQKRRAFSGNLSLDVVAPFLETRDPVAHAVDGPADGNVPAEEPERGE